MTKENEDKQCCTSDVNFAAYLGYKEVPILGTNVTIENNRPRVWFNFEIDSEDFKKHKDAYFGQLDESNVIAHKFFQQRDRMYSLMIQVRNSHKG